MPLILHIAMRRDWQAAQPAGYYQPAGLSHDGFVHCSTPSQVIAVADALFAGRPDLVLLCIDTSRLAAPLRYENLEGGTDLFPHVYGPLNLAAVMRAIEFTPGPDGSFALPADLPAQR